MDWSTTSAELLRALRGRRSQRQLSRRLGFESNVIYRWESGRSWPAAGEFFRLAGLSGKDVGEALDQMGFGGAVFGSKFDWTEPAKIAEWLGRLRGSSSIQSLAEAMQCSRFVLSRWFAGKTLIRLPELLKLVHVMTRRGLDFLAVFADPAKLTSVSREWKALNASRNAARQYPWSQAVLRVLELEAYAKLPRHRRGWIAKYLGISVQEEQRCLRILQQAGQIRLEDERWVVEEVRTVDTSGGRSSREDARGFWLEVAHEQWERRKPGMYAYNICSISEADLQRLQALHLRYFTEMRELIARSSPNQRVVLFATQLIHF